MKVSTLKKYAKLIAVKGVNVKKGQTVIIYAELDQPVFVEYLTEACYRAGAGCVRVEWSHQNLTRYHVRYRTVDSMAKIENWEIEKLKHRCETLPARIHLMSEDPDGLNGVDMSKFAIVQQKRYPILKPYHDQLESREQWCIAAVPGKAWAKKVFPGERESRAVELLWEAILSSSRADGPDPVAAWEEHNRDLRQRCEYLNSLGIDSLHYTASNGTDLTVGLIPAALFLGGEESTLGTKRFFNPNIPSEEVFTSPRKGAAEGVVYASRPYSYQGQLIEGIRLVFRDGKVVESSADTNEAQLHKMLAMDEGASYLGECALVPYHSPISQSGILFYNTLFDENAACHIALGMGFPNCISDYEKFTLEQCRAMGINDSMIHEDLMIGTPDLCITARTRDGREIAVFRDGDWAF